MRGRAVYPIRVIIGDIGQNIFVSMISKNEERVGKNTLSL